MARKIIFLLLWVGFIGYAFFLAPPDQPDTFELIQNLSTGNWKDIDPSVIALFNLMGIWPLIYASVLFSDGRGQKIRSAPFIIGSLAVGAFAILPYLALRSPNPEFKGEKDWILKIFDAPMTGIILTIAATILLTFGLLQGDWASFFEQWKASRFIHVMSLDFCLLCLLFPTLLEDDMARRELKLPLVFWLVTLVPLLGPLAYWCFRPPLGN